jgi:hypothetical protein
MSNLERGKLHMMQSQLTEAKSDFHYALELTTNPAVKAEAQTLLEQLATQTTAATPTVSAQAAPSPQPTIVIASGPPLEVQPDRPFVLPIGHTARLQESNLILTFLAMLEDSRCPSQVDCVWSGQARITIRVQQGELEPTSFELNTLYSAKQDTVTYAGYTIQLTQLDPYPDDPNVSIPPEAYQATFVITGE